jgi:hypothetical protein
MIPIPGKNPEAFPMILVITLIQAFLPPALSPRASQPLLLVNGSYVKKENICLS